jgi:hypothetical protein
MKLVKTASGKKAIKLSKKEWVSIGKKAGWLSKEAIKGFVEPSSFSSFYAPDDDEGPECPECDGPMEIESDAGRGYYNWRCLNEECSGYINNEPDFDEPDFDYDGPW